MLRRRRRTHSEARRIVYMRSFRIGRASILLAAAALALAVGSPTASALPTQPRLTTGGALHMLVSSAELTAVVNPEGFATSCYFQYGTTSAYGAQTVPVDVGSGSFRVKVGQSVAGLQQGNVYHYRAVAVYGGGRVVYGRDRSFLLKTATPKIELARVPQVVVGTPFMVTGTLTGTGNANKTVTLQATSFPYLEAFATIGLPAVTNASGRFAFRVANLKRSTEFRVLTVEPSPAYSPV